MGVGNSEVCSFVPGKIIPVLTLPISQTWHTPICLAKISASTALWKSCSSSFLERHQCLVFLFIMRTCEVKEMASPHGNLGLRRAHNLLIMCSSIGCQRASSKLALVIIARARELLAPASVRASGFVESRVVDMERGRK